MMTKTTLPTAILTFVSTGVFGPHKTALDYEAPRSVSTSKRTFIQRRPADA